jgi:hypothetical protein
MKRLTVGLGIAVVIFILLCTVACGGGDGSLAQGGINMIVVSGQARIRSGEGDTSVVEGQEAVITAGDQIMAGEAGVKLLLADGSSLYLSPDTDLQVITFSSEGTARLRSQLKGRLEVEAASPLLTLEISTFVIEPLAVKTIQFTATPTVRDTTFQLWIDDVNNAHLTVEVGGVNVIHNDRTATISAGSEVQAILGGELIVSPIGVPVGPTAVAVATAELVPTITPDLSRPSPTATATATVVPYLYPAPGLHGPGDGSDFKPSDDILLMWDAPIPLAEDEWYEVQLWREGDVPYTVAQQTKEGTWKVERKYYPGRYRWRILIVRGLEGHKQVDLSPPSQTWSFGWRSPPVSVPTAAPTSPPLSGAPVDLNLTIYLRDTRAEMGFAALSGDQVNGGMIYEEGKCVYGEAAVQIGNTVYHFDKPEVGPGEPGQLPDPWRVEFEFAEELLARTGNAADCAENGAAFDPQKAQFWVGRLDDDSAVGEESPYSLTMKLYEGNELRKSIQVFFTVADAPESPGSGDIITPPPRP